MAAIIAQLGLDQTLFVQFFVFTVIFFIVPNVFFKPFQKLIEARHERTVSDQARAEELLRDAQAKLEEFRTKMGAERTRARAEYEKALSDVKAEESRILASARDEAKKVTQAALEAIQTQSAQLRRSLEADVEGLALQVSDLLTKR